MPQRDASIARQLGAMLQTHFDSVAAEPLPPRWIELIHALNEQERSQARPRSSEGASGGPAKPRGE